jgi:predicted Zn-ribbon and HTH transcriptional regulator
MSSNDIITKVDLFCPKCKSIDISRNYYIESIYGSLPCDPKDYCNSCGFTSKEKFDVTNFIEKRDNKIKDILDGI